MVTLKLSRERMLFASNLQDFMITTLSIKDKVTH